MLVTFFLSLFSRLVRTADELHTRENVDAAGQEHGEALEPHAAVGASGAGRRVPRVVVAALGLVVDVVEEAVLRHQQSVALERSSYRRASSMWA